MRLSYIDTAKFFAIFFVLVGHADLTSNISALFYSFHVQLFFILYGYVHKRRENLSGKEMKYKCVKLFNRLMLPFILLFFLLGNPLTLVGLIKVFYGTTWISYNPGSLHLWFLPCFFISAVIFEYLRTRKWFEGATLFFIMIAFGIISAYANFDRDISVKIGHRIIHFTYFTKEAVPNESHIGFPYSLNIALSGVIFMYIGCMLRHFEIRFHLLDKVKTIVPILVISFVLGYCSFMYNQEFLSSSLGYKVVSMGAAFYGNYFLFISTSVLLTIATVCLAKLIDNKLFSRFGKSTMEIYCFHMIFLPISTYFIGRLAIPNFGGLSCATLCLALSCVAIPFFDYLVPSLKARSQK